jgi:hypothetical protein
VDHCFVTDNVGVTACDYHEDLDGVVLVDPTRALKPIDDPAPVPTAISVFGGERVPFPKPPRELAERYFTLTGWAEHDRGGHFPAIAEPALLAGTLRDFFRPLRQH